MSDESCPSAEALRAFALGALPETEIDEIVVHLASCPACEAELTHFDGLSDPLVRELRLHECPARPARRQSKRRQAFPACRPSSMRTRRFPRTWAAYA